VQRVYILIDLKIDAVELAEPDDTKHFHIAIAHGGSDTTAEQVLENTGLGRLDLDDDDHAWISAGKVRALAAGRVAPRWSEDFDTMLAKAVKHGHYDEATEEIKGHVEWISREQEITGFEAPADE
jgi:hypothetical protein